jgi:hypothetical protein
MINRMQAEATSVARDLNAIFQSWLGVIHGNSSRKPGGGELGASNGAEKDANGLLIPNMENRQILRDKRRSLGDAPDGGHGRRQHRATKANYYSKCLRKHPVAARHSTCSRVPDRQDLAKINRVSNRQRFRPTRGSFALVCTLRGVCGRRQLQHSCALAFAETGQQHDMPSGELKGIMVNVGLIHINLAETGDPFPDLPDGKETERRFAFDILLKRELGAGEQAHRHI